MRNPGTRPDAISRVNDDIRVREGAVRGLSRAPATGGTASPGEKVEDECANTCELSEIGHVLSNTLSCLRVACLDVLLQLVYVNAPLAPASHLNGEKLAALDERAHLSGGDIEILGDVSDSQELTHDRHNGT